MRKILLTLFAMALLVAFTAPADAAKTMKKPAMKKKAMAGTSFKFTGFFRVRGASTNNEDGNDDIQDGKQYYDQLIRPRLNASTLGGKIKAMVEPDIVTGGTGFGSDGRAYRTNRWIVDFAVPGSALRMRLGRTDYTSPDGEIFDTGGKSRLPGLAMYGKLAKNMSLSMFNSKSKGGTSAENDDQDNYMVALSIKLTPALTLTPWVANSRDSEGDSYNYWYGALTAKAKVGVFSLNTTGVVQAGELSSTEDISAWALLVRASTSMGKLKLDGNLTMLSGDDDATDTDSNQFLTPRNGSSGWFLGGQIKTAKGPWRSFSTGPNRDREYRRANGVIAAGGVATYSVSKTFKLLGGAYVYQSAEAASATADSKDIGSEVNVGFSWTIYKGLVLQGVGAYYAAGDYGREPGDREADDTWLVGWDLTHKF